MRSIFLNAAIADMAHGTGYFAIFGWVFLEQLGAPIPAFPVLIAAGVFVAQGHLSLGACFLIATVACLIADSMWFQAGLSRGHGLLNTICKLSWRPDSCIGSTKAFFTSYGVKVLTFAKFVPGLSTIAPPLAGIARVRWGQFLIYDTIGSMAYAIVPLAIGMFAPKEMGESATYIHFLKEHWLELIIVITVGFAVWRFYSRWTFRMAIRPYLAQGIEPQELMDLLAKDHSLDILDVRHASNIRSNPFLLPRARHVDYYKLATYAPTVTPEKTVIVYCDCPGDEAAGAAALKLKKSGVAIVRPLLGGLRGWRAKNFQTEPWKS
jgi:membrane protein DedA with SNARE-associated domain/rhodanese-related sulfurtransferase